MSKTAYMPHRRMFKDLSQYSTYSNMNESERMLTPGKDYFNNKSVLYCKRGSK